MGTYTPRYLSVALVIKVVCVCIYIYTHIHACMHAYIDTCIHAVERDFKLSDQCNFQVWCEGGWVAHESQRLHAPPAYCRGLNYPQCGRMFLEKLRYQRSTFPQVSNLPQNDISNHLGVFLSLSLCHGVYCYLYTCTYYA